MIINHFGASGTIIDDTIFYFGGAASSSGFPIQNQLRKGIINPSNPLDIAWNFDVIDTNTVGYRMACVSVNKKPHWFGGSNNTYNYDGIAYDGSGGVAPNNRLLVLNNGFITTNLYVPMDLRGIAKTSDTVLYIMGGMETNQKVSDKILKVKWNEPVVGVYNRDKDDLSAHIFPNPTDNYLNVNLNTSFEIIDIKIYNSMGRVVFNESIFANTKIPIMQLSNGIHFIHISDEKGNTSIRRFVVK